MSLSFYLALGGTLFWAMLLGCYFLSLRNARATFLRVLEATQTGANRGLRLQRRHELGEQLLELVHNVRMRLGLSEDVTLRERVESAGFKGTLAVDLYVASRVLLPILAFVIGSTISWNRMFSMIALPAVCYLLPDIILQRLVKRRREQIRRSIPDTIDLLVICVDAGLGIDQAMLRVGQELSVSHPQMNEELLHINREQRAGRTRLDAWQSFTKRTQLPDIQAFVNMLTQTERFGTPISKALSEFADGVRQKRRQRAEEMAAKTTVKMIFPLVLTIFPSIFIVLVGPAVITILHGLSTMGK
jgi:tight adherence protein C